MSAVRSTDFILKMIPEYGLVLDMTSGKAFPFSFPVLRAGLRTASQIVLLDTSHLEKVFLKRPGISIPKPRNYFKA